MTLGMLMGIKSETEILSRLDSLTRRLEKAVERLEQVTQEEEVKDE